MVIGAGKMSELTARHLRSRGIGGLIFANRTFERAAALAKEHQGTAVRFEEILRYLPLADVVLGSTAASDYVLTARAVEEVLRERKRRPMFFIDLAVPRNFDPAIHELENVFLYDIDDLQDVLARNREERGREAKRAEAMVEQEVEAFWQWFQSLEAVPTIVEIRRRADEIRRREVERTLAALPNLGPAERRAIEAMSEALMNKLLHHPLSCLKGRGTEHVAVARRLFGLDADE
jgi:glutamyl-tRNA reductase